MAAGRSLEGLNFGLLRQSFSAQGQHELLESITEGGGRVFSVGSKGYNTEGSTHHINYLVVPSLDFVDLDQIRRRRKLGDANGPERTARMDAAVTLLSGRDPWTSYAAAHSVPIVDDKWVRIQSGTPTGSAFTLANYGATYNEAWKGRKRPQILQTQSTIRGRSAGAPQIDIASAVVVAHDALPPPHMTTLWYREMLVHNLLKYMETYDGTRPGASMKECLKAFSVSHHCPPLDWAQIFRDYSFVFKRLSRNSSVFFVHAHEWPTPPPSPSIALRTPSREVLAPLPPNLCTVGTPNTPHIANSIPDISVKRSAETNDNGHSLLSVTQGERRGDTDDCRRPRKRQALAPGSARRREPHLLRSHSDFSPSTTPGAMSKSDVRRPLRR